MTPESAEQREILKILTHLPNHQSVISYRQAVYSDLQRFPGLAQELRSVFDSLNFGAEDTKKEFRRKRGIWELVERLRTLETYGTAVRQIQALLAEKEFHSEGLCQLKEKIQKICEDSGFEELLQDIAVLGDDVAAIRSMTIGVNFRGDFVPGEAGIISLNTYSFGEKGLLQKFMEFHRKKHPEDEQLQGMTILTHDENAPAGRDILMNNLTNIIEEMLPQLTARLNRVLKRYADVSGRELSMIAGELTFYLRFMELEEKLRRLSLPCCMPEFTEGETALTGFYNVWLALSDPGSTIVDNDLTFQKERCVLLLTGPNRGGKTIFTQAIGLVFLLAQQGVFVPCRGAKLRLCDTILTHFPTDENQTMHYGRLGEEAERFAKICQVATSESLLLFNESFATTSHSESLYIAQDALKFLCCLGARTCFNTHIHELAENLEQLETEFSVTHAVSLVMGRRDSQEAFRVQERKPEGKSYAHEIASRYGITFEQLMSENIKNDSRSGNGKSPGLSTPSQEK